MTISQALRDKDNLVSKIIAFFDKEKIDELANKTKFVQRESRLTGIKFFMMCLFSHQQNSEISLEGLCNEFFKDGIKITKQSIDNRFNEKAVNFMKAGLKQALSQKLNTSSINPHKVFKRIILEDSTSHQLPPEYSHKYKGSGGGASTAGIKVQYAYDLLSHEIIEMVSQSGNNSDLKQSLGEVKKTTYE